jgi:hypothetical protein
MVYQVKISAKFAQTDKGLRIEGPVQMQSDNLRFISAGQNDNTMDALKNLFNKDINSEVVANYADGTHWKQEKLEAKYNIWGGREEKGQLFRTFFVYKSASDEGKDASQPIGFATVGVNGINVNNFETGIFFNDETLKDNSSKSFGAEAVSIITQAYPFFVQKHGGFSEKAFVFYDSSYQPFKDIAQEAGFAKIENISQLSQIFGEGTSEEYISKRFSQEGAQIFEGDRAVDAYFYNLQGAAAKFDITESDI